MSYRVEYDPKLKKRYPSIKIKGKKDLIMPILISVFVAVVAYTAIRSDLVQYFIPGNPQATAVAFSGMMEQVRTGDPIIEAVFCFFMDVIKNGA